MRMSRRSHAPRGRALASVAGWEGQDGDEGTPRSRSSRAGTSQSVGLDVRRSRVPHVLRYPVCTDSDCAHIAEAGRIRPICLVSRSPHTSNHPPSSNAPHPSPSAGWAGFPCTNIRTTLASVPSHPHHRIYHLAYIHPRIHATTPPTSASVGQTHTCISRTPGRRTLYPFCPIFVSPARRDAFPITTFVPFLPEPSPVERPAPCSTRSLVCILCMHISTRSFHRPVLSPCCISACPPVLSFVAVPDSLGHCHRRTSFRAPCTTTLFHSPTRRFPLSFSSAFPFSRSADRSTLAYHPSAVVVLTFVRAHPTPLRTHTSSLPYLPPRSHDPLHSFIHSFFPAHNTHSLARFALPASLARSCLAPFAPSRIPSSIPSDPSSNRKPV
ncbi:hypothetical protein OF83DRAFT_763826 [Amylostereum chailletii]|nr:hypothetical protein OF83DRAFT_763826 [Amylostereum chailletii]